MQHLTFCDVGSHQQNGLYERIIKELTFSSRNIMLHDQRYWSEYINTMLWTFDFVAYIERMNNIHVDMNGKTPEMKSQTQLDQLLG